MSDVDEAIASQSMPKESEKEAPETKEKKSSPEIEPEDTPGKAVPPVEKDIIAAQEAKMEGNKLFKEGKIDLALGKYDRAILLCPETNTESLAAFHCNSAACHGKLERWELAVKSCSEAIKAKPDYVKAYARRSVAHEKQDKPVEAYEDIKKAMELAPNTARFKARAAKLSVAANERQEKMKDEMLGKLKDLGNMFLGNFGMSMDNFKAQKDPNTGSYNIQFQQNPGK
ncbi:hypothetical protein AAMO2058_001503500 [Amorphochlora amoebiformis]